MGENKITPYRALRPETNTCKIFHINGCEITATFTDCRNTAAIEQVKQILLSSFIANGKSNRTFAETFDQIDNVGGYKPTESW